MLQGKSIGGSSKPLGATIVSPLGITFEEILNTHLSSNKKSFVCALDMPKVVHVGFTGEDADGVDSCYSTSNQSVIIPTTRIGTKSS